MHNICTRKNAIHVHIHSIYLIYENPINLHVFLFLFIVCLYFTALTHIYQKHTGKSPTIISPDDMQRPTATWFSHRQYFSTANCFCYDLKALFTCLTWKENARFFPHSFAVSFVCAMDLCQYLTTSIKILHELQKHKVLSLFVYFLSRKW